MHLNTFEIFSRRTTSSTWFPQYVHSVIATVARISSDCRGKTRWKRNRTIALWHRLIAVQLSHDYCKTPHRRTSLLRWSYASFHTAAVLYIYDYKWWSVLTATISRSLHVTQRRSSHNHDWTTTESKAYHDTHYWYFDVCNYPSLKASYDFVALSLRLKQCSLSLSSTHVKKNP